jgi:hypothetical protein
MKIGQVIAVPDYQVCLKDKLAWGSNGREGEESIDHISAELSTTSRIG